MDLRGVVHLRAQGWGALGPALEWGAGLFEAGSGSSLTSLCSLREVRGGEGAGSPSPQPTTRAPRPAKQVNVLSSCNKAKA